jgi:flagellar biogenesis protein FliO
MGKFAIVLALFGIAAMLLKKFIRGDGRAAASRHGSFGAIRRFAANRLGTPAKMIDIVSTHHLGPKKSIVVANIAGRMLVLGISNESINLITQLGATPVEEPHAEDETANALIAAIAPESEGPSFAGMLESEGQKPTTRVASSAGASVRNQIRNRLEGLKQL